MGACLQPQGTTTFQVHLPNTNVPVVKVVFATEAEQAEQAVEPPNTPIVPEVPSDVDSDIVQVTLR